MYFRIFHMIFSRAGRPNLLVVGSKSDFRDKKWAIFYMKEEQVLRTTKTGCRFHATLQNNSSHANEEQGHAPRLGLEYVHAGQEHMH